MEMIIVIALLILISILVGIKLPNKRKEKYEKQCERIENLEGSKKNILFIINMIHERINNLEKNTLSRKPPFPPPPDSFFRKPSESSPRK